MRQKQVGDSVVVLIAICSESPSVIYRLACQRTFLRRNERRRTFRMELVYLPNHLHPVRSTWQRDRTVPKIMSPVYYCHWRTPMWFHGTWFVDTFTGVGGLSPCPQVIEECVPLQHPDQQEYINHVRCIKKNSMRRSCTVNEVINKFQFHSHHPLLQTIRSLCVKKVWSSDSPHVKWH